MTDYDQKPVYRIAAGVVLALIVAYIWYAWTHRNFLNYNLNPNMLLMAMDLPGRKTNPAPDLASSCVPASASYTDLSWEPDPVQGFRIQIASDQKFKNIILNKENISSREHSYRVSSALLPGEGKFYWRYSLRGLEDNWQDWQYGAPFELPPICR